MRRRLGGALWLASVVLEQQELFIDLPDRVSDFSDLVRRDGDRWIPVARWT